MSGVPVGVIANVSALFYGYRRNRLFHGRLHKKIAAGAQDAMAGNGDREGVCAACLGDGKVALSIFSRSSAVGSRFIELTD